MSVNNHSLRLFLSRLGFYVGFSVLLLRDIPFSAIQWPIYEYLKKGKQELTFLENSVNGATAAFVAASLTTPMDVIKTKMMTQNAIVYKSAWDCLRTTVKDEGALALFKGVSYRSFPLSVTGIIFFTSYERIRS